MRLELALTSLLLAFTCAENIAAPHIITKRQSSPDSTSIATFTTSAQPPSSAATTAISQTSSPSAPSSSTISNGAGTSTASTPTHHGPSSISSTRTASGTHTAHPSASSSSTVDQLPLQPVITPAIGIAGVFLIVSGLALGVIGIKHKAVHTFLSSALLISLSVTVLIVYLMSPPVSNAVQGGYFVAIFVTGALAGGVSLVFQEITESLGCLLGGFCLAMWFLVLSSGGLVQSTTGKAVMIALFSLVAWCFAFSHYTRNYGLILCTSFSGATATILGIDCFSRAGLAQFWIYLWHLNSNEFPLGTTTYPVTRGIRVEIAGIIILFLFGLMSQFKIWKVVKQRREMATMDRLRDLESRDQHDAAVGRVVEARNMRSLAYWQAKYDGKSPAPATVDSGIGSSVTSWQKHSSSVSERDIDAVEMVDMPENVMIQRTSRVPNPHGLIVTVTSEEDNLSGSTAKARPEPRGTTDVRESIIAEKRVSQTLPPAEGVAPRDFEPGTITEKTKSLPEHSAIPAVVPLPFSPPLQEESDSLSDRVSIGTAGTAGRHGHQASSLRMSISSWKQRTSLNRFSASRIDEDAASSVAATADDVSEVTALSDRRLSDASARSVRELGLGVEALQRDESAEQRPLSYVESISLEQPIDEVDNEELLPTTAASVGPVSSDREAELDIHADHKRQSRSGVSARSSWHSVGRSTLGSNAMTNGLTTEHLPESLSRVALAYRTNEWAKHIADADHPEAEERAESPSPGMQIDHNPSEETSKEIDPNGVVGGGQEHDAAVDRTVSRASSNPYRQSKEISPSNTPKPGPTSPIQSLQSDDSRKSLSISTTSAMVGPAGIQGNLQPGLPSRKPSTSVLTHDTIIESPTEEESAFPMTQPASSASSSKIASERGMARQQSDRLVRNPTTTSIPLSISSPTLTTPASLQTASLRGANVQYMPEPTRNAPLTLVQQQAYMEQLRQQQTPTGQMQHSASDNRLSSTLMPRTSIRAATNPSPSPTPMQPIRTASFTNMRSSYASSTNRNLIYDSHQPQRGSGVDNAKQATMLNQWRASLADEVIPSATAIHGGNATAAVQRQQSDAGRAGMIAQKQWTTFAQQQAAEAMGRRQSAREVAMRTGQMHGAHQDILRRMQAQATHNAG